MSLAGLRALPYWLGMFAFDAPLSVVAQWPLYALMWAFGDDTYTKAHFFAFALVYTFYAFASVALS
jgi:hypothetical protein